MAHYFIANNLKMGKNDQQAVYEIYKILQAMRLNGNLTMFSFRFVTQNTIGNGRGEKLVNYQA